MPPIPPVNPALPGDDIFQAPNSLRYRLAHSLPFYYGWVILSIGALASYSSRPLMAVATLSVFAVPMTREFGWSYGLFSGVVSLGGVAAIGVSPIVGRLIDRYGSGVILAVTSAVVGCCAIGLSMIGQAWAFYALYVPGRMAFASPLELGTTTAVNNWFIRRRPLALYLLTLTQGTGLAAMPLAAQFLIGGWDGIGGWGWRNAWAWLGMFTLAVGILPALLLVARRPEDMGLKADPARGEARTLNHQEEPARPGRAPGREGSPAGATGHDPAPSVAARPAADLGERNYSVSRALRTRSFYVMAVFSGAGFMVQAGVSLHQVSHFINQGLEPSLAALTAGAFAFCQVLGGLVWSALASWRVPIRFLLAMSALCVSGGALGVQASETLGWGLPAASVLGAGVGGLHLLLRLAWAEYYGRQHLGSITGITLPVQVGGQALGPVIAGFLYDHTGSYLVPFRIFAIAVFIAGLLVLTATPPKDRE